MNILQLPLKEIRPYERNPRKNDKAVAAVAESIKQYGFLVPIVISADHEIITGHTRYKAALALGMQTIPCVMAEDLTEDQARAFRLVDNKVGEIAEWDFDLLPLELADIAADLGVFGFDSLGDDDFDDDAEGVSGKETSFNYQEQYGVIVMCTDEVHQQEVYDTLAGMGYNCKVVAT